VTWKRPESVLVVVHTRGGEVLLLRRREPADWWQSVTGSLEDGETALRAALRELREETGLIGDADLEDAGIVNTYPIIEPWRARFAPGVTHNTEHVFRIVVPERFEPRLAPAAPGAAPEHLEHAWLSKAAALERATSVTDRAAIGALVPE
jgi:dATP pyrophosphohydrolase